MNNKQFKDFNLSKEVLKAVNELGFEEPTPIQSEAIPFIIEGKDVVGLAKTGTGKTAAFGLPLVDKIDPKIKQPQLLVLAPTRELAVQIAEQLKFYSTHKKGIYLLPIYGGQSIDRQIMALNKGINIVVGTPGRIIDHIERGTLKLNNVKYVVLDEADEMLNMGFIEDIEKILSYTSPEKQTVMFSATMSQEIMKLAQKYLKNPEIIKVIHDELTVENIEQYYFEVKASDRIDAMCRIFDIENFKLALVFCNTKKMVDDVVVQLQARGYSADALHGDMSQAQRDKVMNKFKKGIVEILVATDVAARGLDINDVDAVFNFDIPQDEEYYVHRIGRTGRAGRSGKAYSFVTGRDFYKLKDIERFTKSKIKFKLVPAFEDVENAKIRSFFEEVIPKVKDEDIDKYIKIIQEYITDDISSIEIAAALLKSSVSLNDMMNPNDLNFSVRNQRSQTNNSRERHNYRDKNDRNSQNRSSQSESRPSKGRTKSKLQNPVTVEINIGRESDIKPKDILGMLANEAKIPVNAIGDITIKDNISTIVIEKDYLDNLKFKRSPMFKGNKYKFKY
jgi:ATP-dependent RNA helicase DeaD